MTEAEARAKFLVQEPRWLGRFGEAFCANIFRASNFHYVPLYKIDNGGAPMMEGQRRIILPDFDVMTNGLTAYLDAKAKRQSIIYRNKKSERHGIDRRCWLSYGHAAKASGKPCGIAIIELFRDDHPLRWSGSLLIESLANLGQPFDGISNQEHMVYWPRKRFCDLQSWSAIDLLRIGNGQLEPTFTNELKHIFWPFRQATLF